MQTDHSFAHFQRRRLLEQVETAIGPIPTPHDPPETLLAFYGRLRKFAADQTAKGLRATWGGSVIDDVDAALASRGYDLNPSIEN